MNCRHKFTIRYLTILTYFFFCLQTDRAQVISQLKLLTAEDKQYRMIVDEKRREMEPLQQALGKLRTSNNSRERGGVICSSEEELDDLVRFNLIECVLVSF